MLGWDVGHGGIREAVHQWFCREGVHLLVLIGAEYVFSGIPYSRGTIWEILPLLPRRQGFFAGPGLGLLVAGEPCRASGY